jgi:3-hydroxyacyl-[acyl-carrier-protein] dehydratase
MTGAGAVQPTPSASPSPPQDHEAPALLEGASLAALLPHRYPFLLVDRIRVIEPGRLAVGSKRITAGEWWCAPAGAETAGIPFSLVVEALAQTTCALLQAAADGTGGAIAYFVAADRVRFRHRARPGDELQLTVTLRSWRRGVCRTHGVATVDGRLVASATLTTMLRATS